MMPRMLTILLQIPDVTGAEPALARSGPKILGASLLVLLHLLGAMVRAMRRGRAHRDPLAKRRALLDARERGGGALVVAGIALSTWSRMHYGHDRPPLFLATDLALPLLGITLVLAGALEAARRSWGSGA